MIRPKQYRVNEAWIAFRLNDEPMPTAVDGDFNLFALMDSTSYFLLCFETVPTTEPGPSAAAAMRMLMAGRAHKQELPAKLFATHDLLWDELVAQAEALGVITLRVPEAQLLPFVSEAREAFIEHMNRDRS